MFYRWGRLWECLRGYAVVDPVGWWFELIDVTDDGNGQVVLFASRQEDGALIVLQHRDVMLPEIVEWFTAEAKKAIGPIANDTDAASSYDSL
jgi:hypothetical protein